jgi:hypothetical protein
MSFHSNPLDGFQADPDAISYADVGLERTQCILATSEGSLWVTHFAARQST